ncbi:MAG: 4-hydroxy-3-methylbut-2-enyl diphosphate reductase [Thermodesulfobacteriota bacterium]
MKILVAKTAGFCMGVRRAVELVLDTANRASGPVYTFGPLIHNPQVMGILAEKGVTVLSEVPKTGAGTVVIRAHGVTPEVKDALAAAGFTVVDATCPRVIKVQTLLSGHVGKGYIPVIVGDFDHPEVQGLLGHAGGNGHVVASAAQVAQLPDAEKVMVVAQTTQDARLFQEICDAVKARYKEVKVFDTICDSTARRQEEVENLAREVDALVVVGGKSSGNTRRLYQIAAREGAQAYLVETDQELDLEALARARRVGITAGASTPTWIIRRVRRALETRKTGRDLLFSAVRALILTNVYIALGAACLCLAALTLLDRDILPANLVVAFCFVFSIHTFNNFIGNNAYRYNDPDRALFYQKYRKALLAVATAALLVGLGAAFFLGHAVFVLLAGVTVAGLLYNVPIVPGTMPLSRKYPRIRAIPGSKTIGVSMAWAVACALLPAVSTKTLCTGPGGLVVVLWVGAMVFCRSALFDLLDVQVDRIVGQETIATWLGDRRTLVLLRRVIAGSLALLLLASIAGAVSPAGFLLLVCSALPALVISGLSKGSLVPGYRLEFLVDTNFLLAGLLAALWLSM